MTSIVPGVGHDAPGAPGKLGRMPARSDTRALLFRQFADLPKKFPTRSGNWKGRAPFAPRAFGNTEYGDCTIAKQCVAALRMERIEVRRTPVIADAEAIRVYLAMTERLYGGGDTGAYETDALNNWRDPALTFTDAKGRAITIDAYVRLDPWDHDALRTALLTAGAKGFPFCINLPAAFQSQRSGTWDIPEGQALTGEWTPGSWGGHSMWAFDYDDGGETPGLEIDMTWNMNPFRLTWRAAAAYVDEAHVVIDSLDAWRKNRVANRLIDLAGIRAAVNKVSALKVA